MTKHIFNCCNGQCQLLHCLPAWQEKLSEINFSLFLPLQNSNVVYLESFCANTVSEDSVPLHRAAFSRNKENLCLFSVGSPAAPVDRYSVLYCTWYKRHWKATMQISVPAHTERIHRKWDKLYWWQCPVVWWRRFFFYVYIAISVQMYYNICVHNIWPLLFVFFCICESSAVSSANKAEVMFAEDPHWSRLQMLKPHTAARFQLFFSNVLK